MDSMPSHQIVRLVRQRVALAAYYIAERQGFAPGAEARNWIEAEAEIDALDAVHR
jgi:hypothetical protein